MRLIDADALNRRCIEGDGDDKFTEGYNFAVNEIKSYIADAPTIEEHIGRWVKDRYCSNCDWSNEDVYFTPDWTGKYCPNCGAKMKWISVDISIKGEQYD